MRVDRLPGMPEDEPGSGDAKPDGQHGSETQPADGLSERNQVTETPDRVEYYVALRTADQQASNQGHADPAIRDAPLTSAWDDIPGADHAPADPGQTRSLSCPSASRTSSTGTAGAAATATGRASRGKTEFPAGWDDKRIIDQVMDVARVPGATPILQPNHRWRVHGERDGVGITVIVHPEGGIWSAWPEEGSPGVVRNPTEGRR
jgi:hypothetical protein